MTTNDEIIDKEDERLGREKEEDNLFGYQSVNRMLNEARTEERQMCIEKLREMKKTTKEYWVINEAIAKLSKKSGEKI